MDENYILFYQKVSQWAEEIDEIKTIIYIADFEDILNLQLEGIETPIAVIELPEFIPDSENIWLSESAIAILDPLTADEYTQNNMIIKMSTLAKLTKRLTNYMVDCSDSNVHNLSPIQPITKATAESLYGWRFMFRMDF